jgi:putative oxidoreductase
MNTPLTPTLTHALGRLLLALLFIVAGAGKLADPAGTAAYMQAMGVPSLLLWPTIALELLGGIALLLGYRTHFVGIALAVFTVLAAAIFHHDFANPMQQIMFLKNMAIAGGLLVAAVAPNLFSLDSRRAA